MESKYKTIDASNLKKWYIICGRGKAGKTCISAGYAICLNKLSNSKKERSNSLLSVKNRSIYFNEDEKYNVVNEFQKKDSIQTSDALKLDQSNKKSLLKRKKILLVSINETESLSETLDTPLNPGITELDESLHVLSLTKEDMYFDKKEINYQAEEKLRPIINSILSLPGIKEVLYFTKIMKYCHEYDHIIVDTWPAFSTINFLSFPEELATLMNKIIAMEGCKSLYDTKLYKEVINAQNIIEDHKIFENCYLNLICTPQTISITETIKLLEQLELCNIKVYNLIINQVLKKDKPDCSNCAAIIDKQKKIISQIHLENTQLIEIDFIPEGIKGMEQLKNFAEKYL